MNETQLEQLFRNSLNPDINKRSESERQLKILSTNKNFILSLPNTFMKSNDVSLRMISATFFKNAVKDNVDIDILNFSVQDSLNYKIYGEIIRQHVQKNKNFMNEFYQILEQSKNSVNHATTALLILDAYCELDGERIVTTNVDQLMENVDISTFFESLSKSSKFRNSMATAYNMVYIPKKFQELECINKIVHLSLNYMDKDSVQLLLNIGCRANKNLIDFSENPNQEKIRNYFFSLQNFDSQKAEYFITFAQNKNISLEEKSQFLNALIQPLILPNLAYKEQDPIEDLRSKYSFNDAVYSSCSILFSEILNNTNSKSEIINFVQTLMSSADPKEKYLGIALFCQSDEIISELPIYPNFIKILQTCLTHQASFVKAQAMYALKFLDISFLGNHAQEIFDLVIFSLSVDDLCLRVSASLCLTIFLKSEHFKQKLENHLGLIINSLVHNPLHLESVSDTLDLVMDIFDVSDYALDIGIKMIESIDLENLETAHYLRILSNLAISLENKQDTVFKIYNKALPILFQIVNTKKYDFYGESIDFLSNVLYSLKKGDSNIPLLIQEYLNSDPEELLYYSEDIPYLLDNYISYCDISNIDNILNFVHILISNDQGYAFEDDFICACRVLESLILNGYFKIQILSFIFDNYHKLEDNAKVYGLEILMNACSFEMSKNNFEVFNLLKKDLNLYLIDMEKNKKRFSRVHDKKVGLFFCACLMEQNIFLDKQVFLSFFLFLLTTFDQQVLIRNNLKENIEIDEEQINSEDEDYFEEDVSFVTPLDKLDVKLMLRNLISNIHTRSPECFGKQLWDQMNENEKISIQNVIHENRKE